MLLLWNGCEGMDNLHNATDHIALPVQFLSIDMAKFICALLVITIHTRPFSDMSDILDFYLSDVIARVAVPLFFSISGYFFFHSLRYENGKIVNCTSNRKRLFKQLKRLGFLYVGFALFYTIVQLPEWYRVGWWGMTAVKDSFVSFFFRGSYYHLWYLLAIIYALSLAYLLFSCVSIRYCGITILALWCIECLLYSYNWIGLTASSSLNWLTNHFPIVFDAVFRAVPLVGVGIVAMQHPFQRRNQTIFSAAFSAIACIAEASILHFCTPNSESYSYLIFTPVMSYFVLQVLLIMPIKERPTLGKLLRNSSLLIYCIHPFFIEIFTAAGVTSPPLMCFLVTACSIFASLLWAISRLNKQRTA